MVCASVRDTSLLAFMGEVRPSLGERQMMVYALLKQVPGGMTNMELSRALGWSVNRVTPRVFELRRDGFVVVVGKRACGVTGRLAYAWRCG